MQLQELVIPLTLDDKAFEGGIENSITKATAFGNIIGNIATSAISGGFRLLGEGIQAVTGFLSDSVGEAASAEEALSQLRAVLYSTNRVAGVTEQQALDLASSLQAVTRFSDEAILSGENMLLTFTNIGKDVFPQATETILDMSQALGQGLKESAIQLGKALNDPINGVTALRRVGVQFTEDQEALIKSLVESGQLEQAQVMILQELQREFGGSAKAAGQTFTGQLDILKNKLSDIKENIGNALIPVLQDLTTRFSGIIDTPEFQKTVEFVTTKLTEISTWILTNIPVWIQQFKDFKENSNLSFESLSHLWTDIVFPAGEQIKDLFENINGVLEKLSPATDKLAGKFTLLGAVQRISVAIATILNSSLKALTVSLELINNALDKVIKNWEKFKLLGGLALNAAFNPMGGKASGGAVIAGQSYNVAEFYRPEVFTPNVSGRIDKLDNSQKEVVARIDEEKLARLLISVLQQGNTTW